MAAAICEKCGSDQTNNGLRGSVHCLACGHKTDTTKER